jgi:hypothetical protein
VQIGKNIIYNYLTYFHKLFNDIPFAHLQDGAGIVEEVGSTTFYYGHYR